MNYGGISQYAFVQNSYKKFFSYFGFKNNFYAINNLYPSFPFEKASYELEKAHYELGKKHYELERSKNIDFFITSDFLNQFVLPSAVLEIENEEIINLTKEIFFSLLNFDLLKDIKISILNEWDFKKNYVKLVGQWHPGILGFSINRCGFGISEIFVLKSDAIRTLLVIGHEIGHVLTPTLENHLNEEAKAFAFGLAWARKIKEKNIFNLSINLGEPAKNGLHNAAFNWVIDKIVSGFEPLKLYEALIKGEINVKPILEYLICQRK